MQVQFSGVHVINQQHVPVLQKAVDIEQNLLKDHDRISTDRPDEFFYLGDADLPIGSVLSMLTFDKNLQQTSSVYVGVLSNSDAIVVTGEDRKAMNFDDAFHNLDADDFMNSPDGVLLHFIGKGAKINYVS